MTRAGVDAHAHVFAPDLPFVSPRRYTPAYAATVAQYIAHLDAHGLEMGLLTQPSFLGTDNSHMLAAVARHPRRLRAAVVVDSAVTAAELDALGAQGAIGIRFNLAGVAVTDLAGGAWPAVLERLRERDWHVEVHGEAHLLHHIMQPALAAGVRVVVDHFGRPDPAAPRDDPGFKYLLSTAASRRVWVKIAAAYRCGGVAAGERTALAVTPVLLDHFGPERLVWGSDWPHTQHERLVDFAATHEALSRWVPDARTRETILTAAPSELFSLRPAIA
jgi:predicted TIM-barrel fold metal-dependent hydrolase